jgi:chemotaxis signal transduction protein
MSSLSVPERDGAELRREFDAAFALPPRETDETLEDVLAIRVGPETYVLRARELSGIAEIRKLVPVPSSAPDLLGLVSVRGLLLPVFGLPSLLGYSADSEPLSWLLLVGSDEPLALAFHALTGFSRLPKSAFSLAEGPGPARETVSLDRHVRVVIGVSALVRGIRARLGRRAIEEGSVK